MEQYVNKSALVAEIERLTDELYGKLPNASKVENGTITISEACNTGKYTALESFRNYIDTIEVKEVDLKKEATEFVQTKEFVKNGTPVLAIAKYFFELGLKTQKVE